MGKQDLRNLIRSEFDPTLDAIRTACDPRGSTGHSRRYFQEQFFRYICIKAKLEEFLNCGKEKMTELQATLVCFEFLTSYANIKMTLEEASI